MDLDLQEAFGRRQQDSISALLGHPPPKRIVQLHTHRDLLLALYSDGSVAEIHIGARSHGGCEIRPLLDASA